MKQLILMGVILLALFACKQEGDTRVVELENGYYAIQIVDRFNDWGWLTKDGNIHTRWGNIMRWGEGLKEFKNQDIACAYAEAIQRTTQIKRVVECE